MSKEATKEKKPLTEIEALARIEKVLNQLTPEQRRKVVAFLSA